MTTDEVTVTLRSNIELPEEVHTALRYGAAGIGMAGKGRRSPLEVYE